MKYLNGSTHTRVRVMKAVVIAALTVGLGAVGANELLSANGDDSPTVASGSATTAAPNAEKRNCWSESKIKEDRFSLRGAAGTIRSFEMEKVEGCVFRVKLEYGSASGSAKTLDYDAEYAAGDRPIFVRYNTPP